MRQNTLRKSVSVSGVGVHKGLPAKVVIHPADENSGISFLRTGLEDGLDRVIRLSPESVCNTELCTIISDGNGASVSTIEHLMSALVGLGIDNAILEVDGPEIPILDGSARLFVNAIDQVGICQLSAPKRFIKILKPVKVDMDGAFVELLPLSEGFKLDVEINFKNHVIGNQKYGINLTPEIFKREIASARTFGFMKDVERLWSAGLALGATLENTVAVGENNVVNPEGLRFPNEFVRHKMLDSIGDLSLAGYNIQGHYRAFCPGHKMNALVVKALLSDPCSYDIVESVKRSVRYNAGRDKQYAQRQLFYLDMN